MLERTYNTAKIGPAFRDDAADRVTHGRLRPRLNPLMLRDLQQVSLPAAFGAERDTIDGSNGKKVTIDIDLARDVCWLNGAGRPLGGNWAVPAHGDSAGCSTLSGSQIAARVRNVRYVSLYLVDT